MSDLLVREMDSQITRLKEEITALKAELSKEREAVDFYANPIHWNDSGNQDYDMTTIDYEDASVPEDSCDMRGGKLARLTQSQRKIIL